MLDNDSTNVSCTFRAACNPQLSRRQSTCKVAQAATGGRQSYSSSPETGESYRGGPQLMCGSVLTASPAVLFGKSRWTVIPGHSRTWERQGRIYTMSTLVRSLVRYLPRARPSYLESHGGVGSERSTELPSISSVLDLDRTQVVCCTLLGDGASTCVGDSCATKWDITWLAARRIVSIPGNTRNSRTWVIQRRYVRSKHSRTRIEVESCLTHLRAARRAAGRQCKAADIGDRRNDDTHTNGRYGFQAVNAKKLKSLISRGSGSAPHKTGIRAQLMISANPRYNTTVGGAVAACRLPRRPCQLALSLQIGGMVARLSASPTDKSPTNLSPNQLSRLSNTTAIAGSHRLSAIVILDVRRLLSIFSKFITCGSVTRPSAAALQLLEVQHLWFGHSTFSGCASATRSSIPVVQSLDLRRLLSIFSKFITRGSVTRPSAAALQLLEVQHLWFSHSTFSGCASATRTTRLSAAALQLLDVQHLWFSHSTFGGCASANRHSARQPPLPERFPATVCQKLI
ncbi:hypothetical protein J6590_001857 [Homalodisca vitripennis]|nr:hypothetical protein J6590_001857 [Homalodisca vitripennis]